MKCQWCGDDHDPTRLCQGAQRGMTRRSFCFLFGAGIGAVALGVCPSFDRDQKFVLASEELLRDSAIKLDEFIRLEMARAFESKIDPQFFDPAAPWAEVAQK